MLAGLTLLAIAVIVGDESFLTWGGGCPSCSAASSSSSVWRYGRCSSRPRSSSWAVPGYLLVGLGSAPALWVAMATAGAAYGILGGVAPALVSHAFPVVIRYPGVGVTLAVSLGAAVLPLPALARVGVSGGSPLPVMVMVTAGGFASAAGGMLLDAPPRPAH
jgi:hypothetical protein